MQHHALVIEPDPTIREEIIEVILSMGHEFTAVQSQKEGLDYLRHHTPAYIIAGLLMPVKVNSKLRITDNCRHFIHQARKLCSKPIIVTASVEFAMKGYGPMLVRAGAFDLIDLPAPSKGRNLGEAIRDALRHEKYRTPKQKEQERKTAKTFTGGTLVFYRDRIELNGIAITDSQDLGMTSEFLLLLSTPLENGKRPKISLNRLIKELKASSSAITSMVQRLRRSIFVNLKRSGNYEVRRQDVIVNKQGHGGGYYLANNITVEHRDHPQKQRSERRVSFLQENNLTERQMKLINHLCRHQRLIRATAAKITRVAERTVKRDLLHLKRQGLIVFVGHSARGYWKLVENQRQLVCPLTENDETSGTP